MHAAQWSIRLHFPVLAAAGVHPVDRAQGVGNLTGEREGGRRRRLLSCVLFVLVAYES